VGMDEVNEPLVIFDLGGTLVTGPNKGPATQIARLLGLSREHKHALHAALMSTPFTGPDEVLSFLSDLTGDGSSAVRDAVNDVWKAQETAAAPLPGAREALEALHDSGHRLAIISNIWPPYLLSIRWHFGDFFDHWVAPELQFFSYREGHPKPSPVMFERALQTAGSDPHRTVMIGDTHAEDIVPAAALGLRTVWLMHRPEREVESLTGVINGDRKAPTRAVASIDGVNRHLIEAVLRPQ
jgi:HAD superfamily hydrolase (TIGR01509 family)